MNNIIKIWTLVGNYCRELAHIFGPLTLVWKFRHDVIFKKLNNIIINRLVKQSAIWFSASVFQEANLKIGILYKRILSPKKFYIY